ncbi:uncharacterized protein LOC136084058 isoform X2 [Hydra vulgaris]|uniref:Uncharacterized protein LOC136084058 isoform X2 n=1 Tax=Hydra vulgaris TaxID=6087 RepID=A0ABM4CEU9_HYDVU
MKDYRKKKRGYMKNKLKDKKLKFINMKYWLPIIFFCSGFKSALLACTNDTSTDFQLTSSGYHVESLVSCVTACNSYTPPGIFSYAFFLEGYLCFCRNASYPQLNLSNFNSPCVKSTCLDNNNGSDCSLSSYEVLLLSFGIVKWSISYNPVVALVDNEVQIHTNILIGDASSAFVIPTPNDLPLRVQNVNGLTVKGIFYLPGLQMWTQEIGNNFTDPFVTTTWIQVDEKVGGIHIIPSTVPVNGFYNFFLVITQGTNISITLLLPMNKTFFFNADIIRLIYGFEINLITETNLKGSCSLSDGFVLKNVILTYGRFTKLKLNVFSQGSLNIFILRPQCNTSTSFCAFSMNCKSSCFVKRLLGDQTNQLINQTSVTALVVKRFLFFLNVTGVIEIPINNNNNDVQENDMVWVGGNAILFCNKTKEPFIASSYVIGVKDKPMKGLELGETITFSTNEVLDNIFYISFFISKPFEYMFQVPSSTVGIFNFTVNAFNHVKSSQPISYIYSFQVPVTNLNFVPTKPYKSSVAGYKPSSFIQLQAAIDNGTDVAYMFDIPALNYSQNSTDFICYAEVKYLGVFTVFLTAANKISSLNTSINVAVLSQIKSFNLYVEKYLQKNVAFYVTISISNGNNLNLTIDFGDGTFYNQSNIDATGANGFTLNVNHTYKVCTNFAIFASASNNVLNGDIIGKTLSSTTNVSVFCPPSVLNVITTPIISQNGYVLLFINSFLILTIYQNTGSYLLYSIDWGDGSDVTYNNQTMNSNPVSFQVQHNYTIENIYNISITSKNLFYNTSRIISVMVKSCAVPPISFYYGTYSSPVTIFRSIGADLTGVVAAIDPLCKNDSFTIQWQLTNLVSKPKVTNGIQVQQKITYTVGKNLFDFGLYNLSLVYNYGIYRSVYTAYFNITYLPLHINIDKGFFNSVAYKKKIGNDSFHQNFTISVSSCYDPDDPIIGIQDITFMWRCKIASNFSNALEIMGNFTLMNLTYKSDTCFSQTWMNISSKTSMNFSTQQFLDGLTYHFEVCGTKYAGKDVNSSIIFKSSCFIQEVLIIPEGLPTISVKCISNCDEKLNFMDRVIYSFYCEDCGFQKLTGVWTINDNTGKIPPELQVQNATTTGFRLPSLVINRNILLEKKDYTFYLEVGYADSLNKVKFKFTKSTCSQPTPGVCYVYPTEGYVLETKFKIICSDWTDSDQLLNFTFYYDDGMIQRINVSSTHTLDYPILNAASTDQPSLINFMMGPGDPNNDYKIKILIKVSGKYQAYTEYNKLFINVRPNNKLVNVTDLVNGINMNDTQSVANIVQAISSTVNKNAARFYNNTLSPSNEFSGMVDNDAVLLKKQQELSNLQNLRTNVINLLGNTTINDLSSFKTVGDALAISSQNPMELIPQSQQQASNIVTRMAKLLTPDNLKSIGADKFDIITQPFLKSISNLLQTNLKQSLTNELGLPTHQTEISSHVEGNMALELLKSLDNHLLAAQFYKVPGENATLGETNQFKFMLRKEFATELSNTSFGSTDDGGFTLPDFQDMFNVSMKNPLILANNIRMKDLVYTLDANRSQYILSETQSLSFTGLDGLLIKVQNTSKPINITVKNIPEKMIGRNISLSMPNDVYQVSLPIASSCNMLLKIVFKNDPNSLTNLIVYIQYGKIASKLDYDIMLNISARHGVVMTKNTLAATSNISFTPKNVNSNMSEKSKSFSETFIRNQDARLLDDGSLLIWNFVYSTYAFTNKHELNFLFSYAGPMPAKNNIENPYTYDEAESLGSFDYEMLSFCTECNYWNEDEKKWMSDGCELDVLSSSFLFTNCKCTHLTAFGGFFVAPNPLPKLSLALLKRGYVLLVTVIIIILLWIIGLVLSRRMDKRDVSKVGVCPLLDNLPGDNYLYQIIVNTGNRRNAGTKSNIFFTVTGENNDSGIRRLKDSERECFQRSSCDMFIMTTNSSLGDLDYIRLWHDNSGGGWYLKDIVVVDLQTEKQFLFISHRWIAIDRGSCVLDCIIPVASSEESTNFTYVFTSKAENNLSDEHLWFSIFARPPISSFTRCQRLTVAVSLLLTSMMVSSMYYGKVDEHPDPKAENKSVFFFNKTQIFVVLISTIIKFPIHLLFLKLFRSIIPFENSISKSCKSSSFDERNTQLEHEDNNVNSSKEALHIVIDKDKPSIKNGKKRFLPYWCLYIAWFLCISNILVCSFFVMWYGIKFGNKTSLNWLTSVTIDFTKEILLTEPIKIFILAVFVALVIKNANEKNENEFESKGKMLALDENWLHKPKNEASIFDRSDIEINPLDSSSLASMRDLRFKKLKMVAITQELVLYTFYAILVLLIGFSTRENVAFWQTRNIQNLFNLVLRGVPRPKDYVNIYNQIQSSKDFWPWMEEFFIPQVFPEKWYNLSDFYSNTEKKDFPGKLFLNDLNSKIVNGIRIRQVRVQSNSCMKANLVAKLIKIDCLSSYKISFDETRSFDLNWTIPKLYNSPNNPTTMPWSYQTWQELDGYPYAAGLETYYGGGYVVEIFPKWKNQAILNQVKKFRWIDRQTRAVIIEFALFNPATNYFSMVTMALEFPASGGAVPNFSVLTFKLYASVTGSKIMLGSHILFILITILFSFRECRFLYRTGCKYFLEFWNLVEVALILLSLVAVGFFFFKDHLAKVLLQRIPYKKPQSFINFQFASYWDLTYVYIVSLIVFFVTLKFIKLLRFNQRVSMLSSTLRVAWYPLSMFAIIFSIILCSVVSTSSIVFGPLLDGYQTYFKALASIISLLLGKFSYRLFENANSVLGPIFFFGFNAIVIWVVMNIFISILNDAFTAVRADLQFQTNDYEIVDFMIAQFKDWLGLHDSKQAITNNQYHNIKKSESNDCLPISLEKKLRKSQTFEFNEVSKTIHSTEVSSSINDRISKLSKYDYLLQVKESNLTPNESIDKFINCMNFVYESTNKKNEVIYFDIND